MPATATRLVTPRQQRFIASLAAERSYNSVDAAAIDAAAAGTLTASSASGLIDILTAAPRLSRSAARPASNDGEPIPAPHHIFRAGRMLLAGGVEATVTLPSGEHVTLNVRTRRPQGRGWTNAAPSEPNARTTIKAFGRNVGWVNVDAAGDWKLTLRTRNPNVREAVAALFDFAARGAAGLRVQTADRCGRCMRTLTDPVSIERGIGPECFGRDTGSRAADVDAQPAVAAALDARRLRGPSAPVIQTTTAHDPRTESVAAQRASAGVLDDTDWDAEFAAREREQETAAFLSDPDYQASLRRTADAARATSESIRRVIPRLTDMAAVAESSVLSRDNQRARDLIAEALDGYCSDADRDFAMSVFDQLAAR